MVKIFYVPFGYRGITEDLLRAALSEIKGNNFSKMLYLAPTPKMIRDARRLFHKLKGGTYVPPEVMTMKQLAKKLYSIHGEKRLIPTPLIPVIISKFSGKSIGFSSIIGDFIDELKQHRPDKDIESVRNEINDVFRLLNVPEEGSKRAMNAIDVFDEYQKLLGDSHSLDENDVMATCPGLIERHGYRPDFLIIDGFYEITPIEELLLKKIVEHSRTALISMPFNEDFTEITSRFDSFIKNNFDVSTVFLSSEHSQPDQAYTMYPGIDEEVEGIARHIKNLYISGKHRSVDSIIVSFPKLDMYSDLVERVFIRYGIPYAFSSSIPVGKTRPMLDLMALLESVADDYPRLQFSKFLTSHYFKKMPQILKEWIPHISLYSGIIKGKDSWMDFYGGGIAGGILEEIHKQLKWVFKKLAPLETGKDIRTYKELSETLRKLLEDLDFSCDEPAIMEEFDNALNGLSFTDALISDNKGLRAFIDSLHYILNATRTDMEGSGVQIADFFELRGTEPDFLYLGGLKDGDLPSMPDIDHILPDNVKMRIGLVNMKRYLQLQKFIFRRLVSSTKNIHLSYPAMEAEKFFLPSPFLTWKTEKTEKIPGILCKEEELSRLGDVPLFLCIREIAAIKNALIKKRFEKGSFIRVTDIDNYRTCPRKFFIEKILDLEPPVAKEYEIEAMLLGTIIHKIMEELVSIPAASLDATRKNAEKILKKVLDEQPLNDYWKDFIRESFLFVLPEIYELETGLMKDGYLFMNAEVPVSGEVINGIKLKGKVDRVNKKNDFIEIIDYKTGATQLSRTDILNKGATLQLFLYAVLMKSLGFKVNRVGIYSIKNVGITWIPGKSDNREGRTLETYMEASLKYLEETVIKMRSGDFTAIPLSEQTCRNCHERPYCPYIQTA